MGVAPRCAVFARVLALGRAQVWLVLLFPRPAPRWLRVVLCLPAFLPSVAPKFGSFCFSSADPKVAPRCAVFARVLALGRAQVWLVFLPPKFGVNKVFPEFGVMACFGLCARPPA